MLAVRDDAGAAAPVAGLDAAAVAVAVARAWADAGRDVLVIDADAHGLGLAGRVAAAARLALRPAQRGLPSLFAARLPLRPDTVAGHCWTLPANGAAGGSLRLLGAPTHPDGAHRAAAWLAERAGEVADLGRREEVVVSMPGPPVDAYAALAGVASQRLTVASAPGTELPGGMRGVLGAFWFRFAPDPQLLLRIVDAHEAAPGRSAAGTRVPLVGGAKRVRPAVLLGARPRRRDQPLLAAVTEAAERLSGAGS